MQKEIREAAKRESDIIIGVFNFQGIDWINVCSTCVNEKKFLDMLIGCVTKTILERAILNLIIIPLSRACLKVT